MIIEINDGWLSPVEIPFRNDADFGDSYFKHEMKNWLSNNATGDWVIDWKYKNLSKPAHQRAYFLISLKSEYDRIAFILKWC